MKYLEKGRTTKLFVVLLLDTNFDKKTFHNELAFIEHSVIVHLYFYCQTTEQKNTSCTNCRNQETG